PSPETQSDSSKMRWRTSTSRATGTKALLSIVVLLLMIFNLNGCEAKKRRRIRRPPVMAMRPALFHWGFSVSSPQLFNNVKLKRRDMLQGESIGNEEIEADPFGSEQPVYPESATYLSENLAVDDVTPGESDTPDYANATSKSVGTESTPKKQRAKTAKKSSTKRFKKTSPSEKKGVSKEAKNSDDSDSIAEDSNGKPSSSAQKVATKEKKKSSKNDATTKPAKLKTSQAQKETTKGQGKRARKGDRKTSNIEEKSGKTATDGKKRTAHGTGGRHKR
ncbi:hypothetical protein HDU96_004995, partial [Phlyctochytrium bullatum]